MNYENPTSLRIGQHGNLAGKDFRVPRPRGHGRDD